MIFVTGDTHIPIDISKLNNANFPEQKSLTKSDYVIILGDFGLIWKYKPDNEERFWTKWLNEKPFTTLFVKGNHENYDRLETFSVTKMFDGTVRQISDSIFMLMDNQIYTIDGKKFYVLGGARSIDKAYRCEGISWWAQELPDVQKCNEVVDLIVERGTEVDYVITHCLPTTALHILSECYDADCLTDLLDVVDENTLNKKHWYCGHYHSDKPIDKLHTILYNTIIQLS